MRDMDKRDTIDVSYRIQLTGSLWKRPFGHQSSKWTRRFFVVRDGFLLYYGDAEKKEYEKRKTFNIHPKGVIPLGGCTVEAREEPGHPYCIGLESYDFLGNVVLAADNDFERDRWVNILRQACRITHENLALGDRMIRNLEDQGLQMAKEKQDYFDALQSETAELANERCRTEELERVKEELEREKQKMEKYATDLREEYETLKGELAETSSGVRAVEDENRKLVQRMEGLQHNLKNLESEKHKILEDLKYRETELKLHAKEKETLSETTQSLQQALEEVEQKMLTVNKEKMAAVNRLEENQSKAQMLEQEKQAISEHASELKHSIKELAEQKAVTENELKEEIMARMEAEKRLKIAEMSLRRLEKNVEVIGEEPRAIGQEKGAEERKEEMLGDVKTLKKFFENLAFEAKLDADKPIMIKNAIHARKTMVKRAKTMRYEANRQKKSRPSSIGDASATSPLLSTAPADLSGLLRHNSASSQSPISPMSRHSSVEHYLLRARADSADDTF